MLPKLPLRIKVMLHGTIRNDDLTQRGKIVVTLFQMVATFYQIATLCCTITTLVLWS